MTAASTTIDMTATATPTADRTRGVGDPPGLQPGAVSRRARGVAHAPSPSHPALVEPTPRSGHDAGGVSDTGRNGSGIVALKDARENTGRPKNTGQNGHRDHRADDHPSPASVLGKVRRWQGLQRPVTPPRSGRGATQLPTSCCPLRCPLRPSLSDASPRSSVDQPQDQVEASFVRTDRRDSHPGVRLGDQVLGDTPCCPRCFVAHRRFVSFTIEKQRSVKATRRSAIETISNRLRTTIPTKTGDVPSSDTAKGLLLDSVVETTVPTTTTKGKST
jgi:hypothetical protein